MRPTRAPARSRRAAKRSIAASAGAAMRPLAGCADHDSGAQGSLQCAAVRMQPPAEKCGIGDGAPHNADRVVAGAQRLRTGRRDPAPTRLVADHPAASCRPHDRAGRLRAESHWHHRVRYRRGRSAGRSSWCAAEFMRIARGPRRLRRKFARDRFPQQHGILRTGEGDAGGVGSGPATRVNRGAEAGVQLCRVNPILDRKGPAAQRTVHGTVRCARTRQGRLHIEGTGRLHRGVARGNALRAVVH